MHKQLKIFLVVLSFFILAGGMFGPIYAIFVVDIGGDILVAGTAWAIFMIVSGIGIFIMGKIQDKLKRDKPIIISGYTLISLGFLAYFFVSNTTQLFLVQILLGLGTMVVVPARDSFYTKYLEKGKIASQWAAWESLWYILGGIAAILGSFFAKIFGFKALFLLMFLLSLVGLVVATQIVDKK